MSDDLSIFSADATEAIKLDAIYAIARNLRGDFIDQTIWIDVFLTGILAEYFVPDEDKRKLLSSDVLTGRDSSFSGRITILEKIVSRSYASFLQEYPNFFKQLGKIRRFRNRLAHAHLDTSKEFLEKEYEDRIQFVFYEDGITKTELVTTDDIKERLKECSIVIHQLLKLQGLVSKKILELRSVVI